MDHDAREDTPVSLEGVRTDLERRSEILEIVLDDQGYWTQIEAYLHEHSEAEFSHGLCPECAATLYPDYHG